MLARLVVDAVVAIVPASVVLVLLVSSTQEAGTASLVLAVLAVGALYAVGLVAMLVVRAFLGVSGPVAFHEGGGPVAALSRSVELLRGHRSSMARTRAMWMVIALVVYGLANVPMLVVGSTATGGVAALVVTLYSLLLYVTSLMLLSFDTALEGVFYAELLREDDAREIARTFE
ncbi:hypothetical protein [Sandaracinus amylolyticus]|uniref:hypothetical protein n=1 Tax=Sandaracinus amylolyticus TaxID=927083 RepID=UPI001F22F1F8|nr:hypothetical protein [Sandaracinus amylolyticus]UJR85794.1 Hypothetical protein I5071_78740 [Sandaracinus amylolyticus]